MKVVYSEYIFKSKLYNNIMYNNNVHDSANENKLKWIEIVFYSNAYFK